MTNVMSVAMRSQARVHWILERRNVRRQTTSQGPFWKQNEIRQTMRPGSFRENHAVAKAVGESRSLQVEVYRQISDEGHKTIWLESMTTTLSSEVQELIQVEISKVIGSLKGGLLVRVCKKILVRRARKLQFL